MKDCQGFSLTAFSGDKLLGGPQCGIIMGQKELVERCRRHPYYRALRCDKLTLALMEEVLRRHAFKSESIPTVELLRADLASLRARVESFHQKVGQWLPEGLACEVVETVARVGGGSLPGGDLPSVGLALTPAPGESEQKLQRRFRQADPPVIVRVEKGVVYLDFRSLPERDDKELLESFRRIFT